MLDITKDEAHVIFSEKIFEMIKRNEDKAEVIKLKRGE